MKKIFLLFLVFSSYCLSQDSTSVMSVESTREVMNSYFYSEHGDLSMMADDVIFTIMGTGEEYHSPDGIKQMLNYFYHVAFEADAEPKSIIYGEGKAVFEGTFIGKHIGEFAGIPATNKEVSVPLCVVYDLVNNQIKRGRVYFEISVLLQQLGVKQ